MSEEIIILDDSDEEEVVPKKIKLETSVDTVAKVEDVEHSKGLFKSPKPPEDDDFSTDEKPVENGSNSNGFTMKKTARKRMSSFTPRLTPPVIIDLDVDETKEKEENVHPEYMNVKLAIEKFVHEIRGCVSTDMEHFKVKGKLNKRLEYIKKVRPTISMESFVEKIHKLRKKVMHEPLNVYEFIKKLLDEMEPYKSLSNNGDNIKTSKKPKAVTNTTNGEKELSNDEIYKAQKTKIHIRKLEKAMRKCDKYIRELEEQDESLEELDSEDSNYIRIDRAKSRFMKMYKKVQELKKEKAKVGLKAKDTKFKTEASRLKEVNEKICDMINKERKFPDYCDILKIYKSVSGESSKILEEKARETFIEVGRQLKKRRYYDDMAVMESYLPEDHDDEVESKTTEEIKDVLDANDKLATTNMNNVLTHFAEKSLEVNEQPEEVGENPESEKDSDDEDEDKNDDDGDNDSMDAQELKTIVEIQNCSDPESTNDCDSVEGENGIENNVEKDNENEIADDGLCRIND